MGSHEDPRALVKSRDRAKPDAGQLHVRHFARGAGNAVANLPLVARVRLGLGFL